MADETADGLREMAQHRGLKLVKSRRRKPGTGDFGKFGLTDDKGKPLLGIGDDGLTASAEDIENYLRAGAARTWQQSAKITPDRPVPLRERKHGETEVGKPALRSRGRGDTNAGGGTKRSTTTSSRSSPKPERVQERELESEAEHEREHMPARAPRSREAASRDEPEAIESKAKPRQKLAAAAKPKPVEVEPELVLRAAKPADAGALAKLLSQLSGVSASKDDVARNLATLRKNGAGIHVAELGRLVGCVAWAVVPTLQRGPLGRITVLVVDEEYRRRQIGTQLLAEAEAALAKKGCALVEVMSDIEIKNSHNFFRTLKFDQTSYRFARKIAG